MSKKRERVLVFDSKFMTGFTELPGITTRSCNQILFEEILTESKFRLREQVEDSPEYKQIIPYTILRNTEHEILLYQRSKRGNEKRLHDLWSIGVGGHINPGDERDGRENILTVAAWRELEEEFKFFPKLESYEKVLAPYAILYSEDTPVDRVHLGIVYMYDCTKEVMKKSEDIATCLWVAPKKLVEYKLEGWSIKVAGCLIGA